MIQQWLTPALLGAGVVILVYIAMEQRALGDKVERALLQIQTHRTVLLQEGLMRSPRCREIR